MSFEQLTPDTILTVAEQAAGEPLTNLIRPLPSYINRVYELSTAEGEGLIAKFYRPGRWSREAILDEHRFVLDCSNAEIPVVAPVELSTGETLGEHDGVLYSLFPKRAGRRLEILRDEDWVRLGSLVARMHLCGEKQTADSRVVIDPRVSTVADIEHLCTQVIPEPTREKYRSAAMRLVDTVGPLFESLEQIRIHGDCHGGNILDRLEEGFLLIDFDDMAMGPPVQDLWLLLPERAQRAQREIDLLLTGYERFRRFDRSSLRCMEPLRAMRMIYFLAWCSRQIDDYQFRQNFPDWGSQSFWQREINDLYEQLGECF